jgi:muramoyltetrapeptide carboxypeptidase
MPLDAVIPPAITPGDTIGIVAPSSPFDRAAFDRGVAVIRDRGFRVTIPESVFDTRGFLAGDDPSRAEAFNRLVVDPVIKAILCARGGYGSSRILPLIDFEALRSHPKIIAGFSDITFILNAVFSQSGLQSLHGPLVTTLDQLEGADSLFAAMTGASIRALNAEGGVVLRGGRGTGRVVGGNLTCFCHLVGTAWQVPLSGRILLLEDRGEEPYRVDRMLTHLKQTDGFDTLAGIAIGGFDDGGRLEKAMLGVFRDAFRHADFPVVSGFPVGHGDRNLTVPIGRTATLDANARELRFHR